MTDRPETDPGAPTPDTPWLSPPGASPISSPLNASSPQSAPSSPLSGSPLSGSPLNAGPGAIDPDLEYLMTPEPERQVGPMDIVGRVIRVLVRKPHVLILLALASAGLTLLSAGLIEASDELLNPIAGLFQRTPMAGWLSATVGGLLSWGISMLVQAPVVGATIEASSDQAPRGLLAEFLRRGFVHFFTVIAITSVTTLFYVVVIAVAVLALWLAMTVAGYLPGSIVQLVFMLACMVTILFVSLRAMLGVSLGVPVVLVEETGVIQAMLRSWRLTNKNTYAIAFGAIIPVFAIALFGMLFGIVLGPQLMVYFSALATGVLLLYAMVYAPATYVVFREQIDHVRPEHLVHRASPPAAG